MAIGDSVTAAAEAALAGLSAAMEKMTEAAVALGARVETLITAGLNKLAVAMKSLSDMTIDLTTRGLERAAVVMKKFVDVMVSLPSRAVEGLADAMKRLVAAAAAMPGKAVNGLAEAMLALVRVTTDLAGKGLGALAAAMLGIVSGTVRLVDALGNALPIAMVRLENFARRALSEFTRIPERIAELGKALAGIEPRFRSFTNLLGTSFQSVELFDPGNFYLFQVAVQDSAAAFGEVLAPALKNVTALIKVIGDAMTNVTGGSAKFVGAATAGVAASAVAGPVAGIATFLVAMDDSGRIAEALGKVMEALAGAMDALIDPLEAVIDAMIPAIEALGDALKSVMDSLRPAIEVIGEAFAGVLAAIVTVIAEVVKGLVELLEWMGLVSETSRATKDKSVGKAAMPAHFTSAESFAQKAYTSAYSLGVGGDTAAERSAGHLASINSIVAEIRDFIKGIKSGDIAGTFSSSYAAGRDGGAPPEAKLENLWSGALWGVGRARAWVGGLFD